MSTDLQITQATSVAKGIRSTLVGILVNAFLAVVKGVVGFFGNSYALIADATESVADVFSSLIVWGGLKIASIPRDTNHPYGHGKAEPIAASIVGLSLFGAAVGIAIQSVREIITPHHAPEPYTLIVLIIVVIVKELLSRYVFNIGVTVGSIAVRSDAWHHRSDAITSAAAFVGISIALIGGTGYESGDDWAALFASCIITFNAYRIIRPAIDEVMDAAPSGFLETQIRDVASKVQGVVGLEKCYIRKMGFEYYVDLHVLVDGNVTVRRGHEIAHGVKDSVRRANPRISDVLVHIEPSENGKEKS